MAIEKGNQPEDSFGVPLQPSKSDQCSFGNNSEWAALAPHTTAFSASVPTFCQGLHDRPLKHLGTHEVEENGEKTPEQELKIVELEHHVEMGAVLSNQLSIPLDTNADAQAIQNDPELRELAAQLHVTAPFAMIDPVFRQKLGRQLVHKLSEGGSRSLETPVKKLIWSKTLSRSRLAPEDKAVLLYKLPPVYSLLEKCAVRLLRWSRKARRRSLLVML